MNGTSMASPHVAGFIAALLAAPEYRGGNIREILNRMFTIDIATPGTDKMTGVGFVTCLKREELDPLLPVPVPPEPCVVL